jgi:hypothetical protein
VQALKYFVATKYVEALRDIAKAPNQKLVLMPLEAASVIGAIGGIGELAREAFNGNGTPGGGTSVGARRPSGTVPPVSGD